MMQRAAEMVESGAIQVDPLIMRRFHFSEAKAAYDLLYEQPQEALGVLLV